MSKFWTVVRFPNGSWSYGGKPSDPDYAECEVFRIEAETSSAAVKKAQARRSAAVRKAKVLGAQKLIKAWGIHDFYSTTSSKKFANARLWHTLAPLSISTTPGIPPGIRRDPRMIKSMWTVLTAAIDRAGLAVASAEHAYKHYGESFTRSAICRHWAEGFFEGLAMALKKVRTGEPAFDSTYTPSVTFKIVGASLIVEAMLTDAAGNATPVVSTLNYVETMSAASGLKTLRNTGVFALTDDQTAELIRCAEHLRSNRSHTSVKNPGLSRPATH